MTTKEEARAQAGQAFDCGSDHSSLGHATNDQRTLLSKLVSITEMIEQHRATIYMLERERLQLQTKLRLTGWRSPTPCGGGE